MSETNLNQTENSKNIKNFLLLKILPFALTFFVIAADQISKAFVVAKIPLGTIGKTFMPITQTLADGRQIVVDYFLRLIHVANTGVAFSVGATWGETARRFLFCAIPLIVIGLVIVVYFRNKDFTKLQRWSIAGIVGGGLGNIIDRFFRAEGVVDFIDVKWFGIENSKLSLFRMTRWPTFNIADSAVVICGILLVISFIIVMVKQSKAKKAESNTENR